MREVHDPGELAEYFQADRATHVYGLADLEEPFWSNSTWYRNRRAVVGLVSVGDDWTTVYAMSRTAPGATLRLLAEVEESVPSGSSVTGPIGLHDGFSQVRKSRDLGPHWRMILEDLKVMPGTEDAVSLTDSDLDALIDLHESDPGSAFFHPAMLGANPFVGIWDDGVLVASAGTHVVSKQYGVAALGAVITRPSHRGRGLGTISSSALCERLLGEYETVGLNVAAANGPAIGIYERLGFRRAFQYEEIELL